MSGAYVAKPPAPYVPGYPPKWDPHWIFPGPPFPPGYAPVYIMGLTADTSIGIGSATQHVSLNLSDLQLNGSDIQQGYPTTTPSGQITWTAETISGTPVQLKLNGDGGGSFADSVLTNYTGDTTTPSFVLAGAGTVLLSASGSPFGGGLSAVASINITSSPIIDNIVLTATFYGTDSSGDVIVRNQDNQDDYGYAFTLNPPSDVVGDVSGNYTYGGSGATAYVTAFDMDGIYQFILSGDAEDENFNPLYWTAHFVAQFYSGATLVSTYTKDFTPPGPGYHGLEWIDFDFNEQTITEVDLPISD